MSRPERSKTSKWIALTAVIVAAAWLGPRFAGRAGGDGGEGGCGAPPEELANTSDEIVGGSNTTIAEHPWQASLQSTVGSHFCGAVIIAADTVLTAQHCVDGSSASSMRIMAGVTNKSGTGQERSISEIHAYPGYVDSSLGEDIAVLRLASDLDLSDANISAIPMASDESLTGVGVVGMVTGLGHALERRLVAQHPAGGRGPDREQRDGTGRVLAGDDHG